MIAGLCAGMALGLCVAAPIGPAAMLCIQRAAAGGMAQTLPTGFGVATMHGLYAGGAAFGLAWLADAFARGGPWLRRASAAMFLWIGLSAIAAAAFPRRGTAATPRPTERAALRIYASTLLAALANPMTPGLFLGLAPGLVTGDAAAEPAAVMAGAFLGSAAWWAGRPDMAAR